MVPETFDVWGRHARDLAERFGVPVNEVVQELRAGVSHAHVVWDGSAVRAFIGTRFEDNGTGVKTCHIVWCTGEGLTEWFSLLPDLEEWSRAAGCRRVKATARPGWSKAMKGTGYAMTHIVMEKDV